MKKIIAWTLVAVLTLGVFMTPAQAVEQVWQGKSVSEGGPRGPGGRGGRGGPGRGHGGYRPGPNYRPSYRHSSRGSGWGWVGGAVIGSGIGAAIAGNSYYRSAEPVLVCDAYGNCYYTYR